MSLRWMLDDIDLGDVKDFVPYDAVAVFAVRADGELVMRFWRTDDINWDVSLADHWETVVGDIHMRLEKQRSEGS